MRITPSNIVKALTSLSKDVWFEYINERTKTKIRIKEITLPEGPIVIERKVAATASRTAKTEEQSISAALIRRVANALEENTPLNLDRVLGASYNTRSAFEALLAHLPEFYWCQPGRIELTESSSEIKRGHKHLLWAPENPHELGKICKMAVDQVISEIPSSVIVYEALTPTVPTGGLDIEIDRRHIQIQIALAQIGHKLGFRTWIAQNDQGFKYGNKRISELNGVIPRLTDEQLMRFDNAAKAAKLIDCIWFRNGKFMPAVIEVEHSTGVTSGLSRMKNLQDYLPPIPTRWVIAAPDEDRDKVLREAAKPQFASLKAQYFPYSAIEELYSICQRRSLNKVAVNEEFLDCFMEKASNGQQPIQ